MADNYFSSKQFLSLLKEYERCENQGIPCIISSDDYIDIAEYYDTHQGDVEHAERVADTAIRLYPGAAAPLVFKARLCMLRGESFDEVRRWLGQVEDTDDLDFCYLTAEIMIQEDKVEEANKYLHDCFEKHQEDEDVEDIKCDIASLFCDYGYEEVATEWMEMAEDKDDSYYQEIMARILIAKGEYEKGETMLNRLLDSNPFVSTYWNSLATSQYQRNNYQESISSSEYSIALNPHDDEAVLNKANGLYQLGNFEEAAEYYQRYIKLRPEDEYGELFLGVCLICLNRFVEAEEHLKIAAKKAEKTMHNMAEIYQELAFTESRLGKVDDALACVDKTEECGADHNEMNVLRGHIMLENRLVDEAQAYFSKAVRESGTSPQIFLRVAVSVYDNGYIPLAHKMFKMLLKGVEDEWTEGYSYLAACAYLQMQREEWLNNLQIAVAKNAAEAKNVLGDFFPEGTEPQDYYNYAVENM